MPPLTSTPNWRGLRFFNAYRLVVATLLLGIHAFLQAKRSSGFLSAQEFDLFTVLAALYALLALGMFAIDELRLGDFSPRLQIGLVLDLIFLALLGALDATPINNLHILMVVNMAYASLLMDGRAALAYAALGSLLLLAMNFWNHRLGVELGISFTHAGLNATSSQIVRTALPPADWTAEVLAAALKATLAEAGLKMPQLAIPVRLAIFGTDKTPSIDAMLALVPRDVVLARLDAALAA